MIYGIGTDIIEVKRIAKSIAQYNKKFLDRIFTSKEQEYCLKHKDSERHFAGRFAAKEAVVKAFGTGFIDGISWHDIEIVNDIKGKPTVSLSSKFADFNIKNIHLSISHCDEYATAFAVYETQ